MAPLQMTVKWGHNVSKRINSKRLRWIFSKSLISNADRKPKAYFSWSWTKSWSPQCLRGLNGVREIKNRIKCKWEIYSRFKLEVANGPKFLAARPGPARQFPIHLSKKFLKSRPGPGPARPVATSNLSHIQCMENQ